MIKKQKGISFSDVKPYMLEEELKKEILFKQNKENKYKPYESNLLKSYNINILRNLEYDEFSNKFKYTGFYFIHVLAKIKNTKKLITIYCGQSLGEKDGIKGRLIDHYKKFKTGKWKEWVTANKENIIEYYFSTFENNYGPAYENFIIYYKVVGIKFHLNIDLNDNKSHINIDDLDYYQPTIYEFMSEVSETNEEGKIYTETQNLAKRIKELLSIEYSMEID